MGRPCVGCKNCSYWRKPIEEGPPETWGFGVVGCQFPGGSDKAVYCDGDENAIQEALNC